MITTPSTLPPLLGPDDPPVFEMINAEGATPLVLICDHAGRNVPKILKDLGIPADQFDRHIAYDIGAAAVTRILSALLDAPAVLHNYSRLVIDCNRPVGHPESMPPISDETPIPANENLQDLYAQQRIDELFWPYQQAISNLIGHRWRAEGRPPALFSVHSFSPGFGKEPRPWDGGVLYHHDTRIAKPMLDMLRAKGLNIGDNQPYSGLESAYTIDVHGISPGIATSAIEIRQDQIGDEQGQERWAELLAECLRDILTHEEIYRVQCS